MNPNDPALSAAIAALPLFEGVPSAAIAELVTSARVRTLSRGERAFDQGETIERAHVLLAGAMRISQSGSDGGQVAIRFIAPSEIFGSVAIFTDGQYPADGIAMLDSIEASWARQELLGLAERYPRIALNLVAIIGHRLAELQNRVREMATQRAESRIANTLLRLRRQAGQTTAGGIEIAFPVRRKDIADIAGTSLYTVSRTLNEWNRRGIIAIGGRAVTLALPHDIAKIAESSDA